MEKNNRTGEPGPFASGDPSNQGWGPINLGIYSGALSGVLGAIVEPTHVPGVLALDTRKTDFFAKPSFPTTLLYNPRAETAKVMLPAGGEPARVWDAVANRWIGDAANAIEIAIAPDVAVLATFIPARLKSRFEPGRLNAGNIIADYSAPRPAPSIPKLAPTNPETPAP